MPSTSTSTSTTHTADAFAAAPASSGMGGKVARGGAWSAVGEAARFVASLIATRYVMRILGPEGYGVWSLVTRVGSSLSFADAGVGVASTKFVSQAFARGDREGERRAMWASLVIGLVPSLLCALLVLLLAPWVVREFFEVQPRFQRPMAIGLQIAAFGFAIRTVTAVFNSPLLARLRLDINALIFHGGIVLQILLTPVALFHGGIVWGTAVSAIGWAIMGAVYLFVTSRLLPGAWKPVLDREMLKGIARMGAGTLVMAFAAQVLAVADLIIVGRFSGEAAAGYYNAAYSASSLLTILPSALSQPLLPAFNRLLERDPGQLQELVRNTVRAICIALPPVLALMCALARPFFAWQGGAAYVANSTPVFLILLIGLALNFFSIVPLTLLLALGRTGATARVSLFEVVPFVLYTQALTTFYGIAGAAMGRSLRFAIASAILFPLAARHSKLKFSPRLKLAPFALALCGAAVPIALAVWPRASATTLLALTLGGVGFYAWIIHTQVLEPGERALVARMLKRARSLVRRKKVT